MLTGTILSLIVFGLAVFIHNTLYRNDLERAALLRHEIRALLDEPAAREPVRSGEDVDFESALLQMPKALVIDALPMFEESERTAFTRFRWGRDEPSTDTTEGRLAPALDTRTTLEAGSLSLSWQVDPATKRLAASLPEGDRLVHRVARALDGAPPAFVAVLPLETTRWRDGDLPLHQASVTYQVWTTRVRDAGPGVDPLTVDSAGGDLVTVRLPDHFTLRLVSGDTERAVIRVEVGPEGQPVAESLLELSPGDELSLGSRPLGLTLDALAVVPGERLTNRQRLVFKSDGSLVLDQATGRPKTDDSQVLLAVNVLIATLSDPSGSTRTLECDLP